MPRNVDFKLNHPVGEFDHTRQSGPLVALYILKENAKSPVQAALTGEVLT
jgi:hypothetical protein